MSGLPALDAVIAASSHSALQGQHDHAGEELEQHDSYGVLISAQLPSVCSTNVIVTV